MTNANSTLTAAALSDADKDALTRVITRKKGIARGKGDNRKVYGDDLVEVLIVTGFDYHEVVEKSWNELKDIDINDVVGELSGRVDGSGNPITRDDIGAAMRELQDSFSASLDGRNNSSTEGNFETLEVDGQKVRAVKVYKGKKQGQKRATEGLVPGTIYIHGLKLSEKILEPAANGPKPKASSSAKTIAKRFVRGKLSVGSYVSYELPPEGKPFIVRPGGTTPFHSDGSRIRFRNATVETLFGVQG